MVLAPLLAAWPNAAAQSADEPAFDEEIVVTGSRIRRDPLSARESVLGLEANDRDRTGLTSLGDMLARLSVSGSPLTTRFNSSGNFGFPADGGGVAAGASQVDLRHLGSKRVLVLVDGVRWVNGSSGSGVSGATDLNTIPAGVVERVEVLRDGASAIYGSNAIAGVVNVITRRTDGFAASVYGGTHAVGGDTERHRVVPRRRTRHRLRFNSSEPHRSEARERRRSRTDALAKPGTGVTHGSTFTPQGRIHFRRPEYGQVCPLRPERRRDRNARLRSGRSMRAERRLPSVDQRRPVQLRALQPHAHPLQAHGAPSLGSSTTHRTVFASTPERSSTGASRSTKRRPEPVWAGTLAESGSLMDAIVIDAANPHNPFGFDVGPGAFVTRRPLESGPRIFRQDVATRYVAAGAQGEQTVLRRSLYWEANLAWSRNAADQTKHGAHNARKMLQALGPPDACSGIPGCVPLNLLGGQERAAARSRPRCCAGSVSRGATPANRRSRASSSMSRETWPSCRPGRWPSPLASNGAAEWPFRSRSRRLPGDTAGQPAQPTAGGFRVTEWYGEIEAPLVSGAIGAGSDRYLRSDPLLRLQHVRQRHDRQDRSALATRPEPAVARHLDRGLPRAEHRRTVRRSDAPRCGHLRPMRGFPHHQRRPNRDRQLHRCGVPADGSYTQLGAQISVLSGGNELLEPETSESVTLALAWRPGWALDLDWDR